MAIHLFGLSWPSGTASIALGEAALLVPGRNLSPKAAQILARHCDINLTMNTYTRLGVIDQAAAVEALPPIPGTTWAGNIWDRSSSGQVKDGSAA